MDDATEDDGVPDQSIAPGDDLLEVLEQLLLAGLVTHADGEWHLTERGREQLDIANAQATAKQPH